MVVVTKCGCLVYDTRSRIGGDICVNYDAKRLILKLNRIKKINFKKYIRVRERKSHQKTYPLSKILKQRHIPPPLHIRSLKLADLLKLGLLWIFV